MKLIKTQNAVGHILCHDMTQIIKGTKKDVMFKKGHIVKEEDIPVLLSMGKEHLYIWEKQEGMLHENEAAEILCAICKNQYMTRTEVKEGKIDLLADREGLFQIDLEKLEAINSLGEMMIATRHHNFPVQKGDKLAGTRVIPLIIEAEKMKQAQELGGGVPLLTIKPYKTKKVGIVTTGSEVFHGRIQDTFGPVVIEKLKAFDVNIMGQTIVGDKADDIEKAICAFMEAGAQMVVCTGGMSVDPDDRTPLAIRNTGAHIVSYGAPVLPGAMFLLAYYKENIPVLGLPGCVMYAKRTIFDLVLPRIMADEKITARDLAKMGHGGLCLNCHLCTYPQCGFGKGM